MFLKNLLVILHADDTVLMSESEKDKQKHLDSLLERCKKMEIDSQCWKK